MQPTVTLTVCVPVMEGLSFAVAVTVAVPTATDFTNPLLLIVAVVVGLMLQLTPGLPVLPSLNVPTANIWTVLLLLPVWMLGDAGPTASEESVGFTKKPRQLAASARPASMATAATARGACFFDDLIVHSLGSTAQLVRVHTQNSNRQDFQSRTVFCLRLNRGHPIPTLAAALHCYTERSSRPVLQKTKAAFPVFNAGRRL